MTQSQMEPVNCSEYVDLLDMILLFVLYIPGVSTTKKYGVPN